MAEDISDIKSKTISGFFWRFGERISAQLVSFIVSVILARILLPEDYGVIAIVTIFIAIADSLVTSGLGTSLIQKKDADEIDFSTIFYTGLLFASVFYFLLYFGASYIARFYKNNLITPVLRVLGIRLFISSINSVQQAYVSRKMIFKKFFFATIIGTIISAIVGIYFALSGYGVWALVAQQLTNPFIDTIVLFLTVKWFPKFKFSIRRLRPLLGFGWKIMLANLIGTIFNKLRSLVIGAKYTSEDLAYYNRGEALPLLITQNITSTMDSVLFPAMSKFQDDLSLVKSAAKKALKMQGYIIIPAMFGFAAMASNIVLLLYTEKWIKAVPFIIIVCFQEMIDILCGSNLQTVKALGKSGTILFLEFIKKPLFLLIIFISTKFNIYAIALTGIINSFLAFFINSYPSKKILNYGFIEQLADLFPIFLMSLIMGVVVFFVGTIEINILLVFILQVIVGIVIYILESVILKIPEYKMIIDLFNNKIRKNA